MTIARKALSAGAVAALSIILAGCLGGGSGGGPSRPSQTGVEGTWIDAQGAGVSSISGGRFTSTAVDTGQTLATGTYMSTGPNSVQISGMSILRQSQGLPPEIQFNCNLVSANQLNCTSAQGTQFVLTRRA